MGYIPASYLDVSAELVADITRWYRWWEENDGGFDEFDEDTDDTNDTDMKTTEGYVVDPPDPQEVARGRSPTREGELDDSARSAWVAQGRALTTRLSRELGGDFDVRWVDDQ